MLTEQEVSRSWSRLFRGGEIDSDAFERAEQLLDGLRSESPLRHRLAIELEELRSRHEKRLSVATKES